MTAAQFAMAVILFMLVLGCGIALFWEQMWTREHKALVAEMEAHEATRECLRGLVEDRFDLRDLLVWATAEKDAAEERARAHEATINMLLNVPFHERAGLPGGAA